MKLLDCFIPIFSYTAYLRSGAGAGAPDYAAVRRDYDRLLAESDQRSVKMGISRREYRDGLFPVCAWVDEAVLSSSWGERESWFGNELQRVHFDTNNAGEQFYTYWKGLRPDQGSVRQVYAMCLALGFRGCYYREEDLPVIGEMLSKEVDEEAAGGMGVSSADLERGPFPVAPSVQPALQKRRKRFRRIGALKLFYVLFLAVPVVAVWVFYLYCDGALSHMVQDLLNSIQMK